MSAKLTLRNEGDLLYATVSGEFSLEQSKSNFIKILSAAKHHGCGKVIVDGRDMTGVLDGPDRFFYGEFAAHALRDHIREGLMRRPPVFAFVLRPPILDPERFGVTVAANRGMRVRAFDNPEEALTWVCVEYAKPLAGEISPPPQPPHPQ